MDPRTRATAAILVLLPVISGCVGSAGVPARAPDVTGVVVISGQQNSASLTETSDRYFEGMSLLRGNPVMVRGNDGERIKPADLKPGDEVQVWISDACAESYPVQCDVKAVRVLP